MNKKDIKKAIWLCEMHQNSLFNLNGADVKVSNIREKKDKYLADIKIITENYGETHKNLEYNKIILENYAKNN